MKRDLLDALVARQSARDTSVVLTWLDDGRQQLVSDLDQLTDRTLPAVVREAIADDSARTCQTDRGTVFVHPFIPALRMIIVGAVHIAQVLVSMASRAGYAVTVVDPRRGFSTEDRIPEVSLSHEWPDAALATLGLDRRCAVVTLSHDPKLDDPALTIALRSDAFYIGALGSRRTHAQRLDRLRVAGFDPDTLARIHGPIGLAIGARSPAEIAVAILAEVTAQLRGANV